MSDTISKIKTSASKFWGTLWYTMKTLQGKDQLAATQLGQVEPGEVIVKMTGITKQFPGVLANDAIDFQLRAGEIHALLGENGAGKTTLARVLYGLYEPDAGEIEIGGTPIEFNSPGDAIEIGIGMVHQHFTLIPVMTVAENIILGLKSDREPLLNLAKEEERITELSKSYGLEVDPRKKIHELPMGVRQRVEIVKALYRGAKILILDEPTSVLTPLEADELFETLQAMVKEGMTIVMITHKLPEVMAYSNRVTVLRRGKVVATIETKDTNPADLSMKMVGRAVDFDIKKKDVKRGNIVLEVNALSAMNDKNQQALKDISFSIHQGEILGIAGVSGNGQSELADVLTGMRTASTGTVHFLGNNVTNHNPKNLIDYGIGDIPEDRAGTGLIMNFSIAENLVLETHGNPPFADSRILPSNMTFFLNDEEIRKYAEKIVADFDIAASSVFIPTRNLSGGNLQKLLLAKVISRNPKLLIAAQPTAGLDVGATEFITNKLLEQRDLGVAVLLISKDLDQIMSVSDRIAVMYDGKIVGIVSGADANIEEIGRMMTGIK